jgi:hypothetical protein
MNVRVAELEYSFSFLAGALYMRESVAIADTLFRTRDWAQITEQARRDSLLRQRTTARETRLLREIRYRLEELSPAELAFFCFGERELTNDNCCSWRCVSGFGSSAGLWMKFCGRRRSGPT